MKFSTKKTLTPFWGCTEKGLQKMCHCHREGVKCTCAVEHSRLQLNSPMTFSQVAAKITLLVFNFVKCTFPEVFHLTRFYYFFIDVSTQAADALSLALEDNAPYKVLIFKHCSRRGLLLSKYSLISISLSPLTHWESEKHTSLWEAV